MNNLDNHIVRNGQNNTKNNINSHKKSVNGNLYANTDGMPPPINNNNNNNNKNQQNNIGNDYNYNENTFLNIYKQQQQQQPLHQPIQQPIQQPLQHQYIHQSPHNNTIAKTPSSIYKQNSQYTSNSPIPLNLNQDLSPLNSGNIKSRPSPSYRQLPPQLQHPQQFNVNTVYNQHHLLSTQPIQEGYSTFSSLSPTSSIEMLNHHYQKSTQQQQSPHQSPLQFQHNLHQQQQFQMQQQQQQQQQSQFNIPPLETIVNSICIFCCLSCKGIIGDSTLVVDGRQSVHDVYMRLSKTYLLNKVTSMVIQGEEQLSSNPGEGNCFFIALYCKGCNNYIGRKYTTTTPQFNFLLDIHVLDIDSISYYRVGGVSSNTDPPPLPVENDQLTKMVDTMKSMNDRIIWLEDQMSVIINTIHGFIQENANTDNGNDIISSNKNNNNNDEGSKDNNIDISQSSLQKNKRNSINSKNSSNKSDKKSKRLKTSDDENDNSDT
ncbi:hypothetical protein DICPUDRAFT_77558 [Dictyostelium purpureum]|uniref:Mis18 domain-containing protein n=1 Tax=Dictyostelium purpureum TaxID=5786 RepID=F0ZGZ1_DICPU|nr:uncharacterized protein DICPUDRAFT_77558 [Dictyostelium purpureum]EGC36816.1 hypothetical protein DICPUDRAFT_77558 [Dictyostelium purpureum]|eukprot:XP_003286687.1 hypothetical protein DICPUDRAFT_77558 [Dictyostelium purpureum]